MIHQGPKYLTRCGRRNRDSEGMTTRNRISKLREDDFAFLAWKTQQDFVVNFVPITVGMRQSWGPLRNCTSVLLSQVEAPRSAQMRSDFREEPSPIGAAVSRLEKTIQLYSLTTTMVGTLSASAGGMIVRN
jgi:hypothetical protein